LLQSMTAARMHRIGAELSLDRVKIPAIAPDEVLVDVKASGICHSDINYRLGIAPVGKLLITLGHEISGVVAKTGAKVAGVHEGENVLVHYVVSCGKCLFCRSGHENFCVRYKMMGKDIDGGFAEFVKVPARSIVKIPKMLPFEQAAIMGCAVPTAYHALKRGRSLPGDTVMILGIGGLGVHAIQLARRVFCAGLVVAIDVLDWKLKLAKHLGAQATVNAARQNVPEAIRRITGGRFADVVVDFVGLRRTMEHAIASTAKGGRTVLVGITKDSLHVSPYKTIIGREMEVVGVDDHLRSELVELVRLVQSRKLDLSQSVTHRVTLDTINLGFRILESRREKVVRVVMVNNS